MQSTSDTTSPAPPAQVYSYSWRNRKGAYPPDLYQRRIAIGMFFAGHWSNEILTIRKALSKGAVIQGQSVQWDLAGKCSNPYTRSIQAKNENGTHSIYMDMHLSCRRCENCLRKRGMQWRSRIQSELKAAPRTWFMTLTLSPHYHYKVYCEAAERLRSRGVDPNSLTKREEFIERHRIISAKITKMFKRIRKAGHVLRYILVAERHKSDLPHYHLLVHEVGGCLSIKKRELEYFWPYGFTSTKLVDDSEKAARYVSKYLFKSADARVRASVGYGYNLRPYVIAIHHELACMLEPLGSSLSVTHGGRSHGKKPSLARVVALRPAARAAQRDLRDVLNLKPPDGSNISLNCTPAIGTILDEIPF